MPSNGAGAERHPSTKGEDDSLLALSRGEAAERGAQRGRSSALPPTQRALRKHYRAAHPGHQSHHTPLTRDAGVAQPNTLLVKALVRQLRLTLAAPPNASTRKSLASASRCPTTPCSIPYPALALSSPQGYSPSSVRSANATPARMNYRSIPASHRSPNAVGKSLWFHWRTRCPTFPRRTQVRWSPTHGYSMINRRSYWLRLSPWLGQSP